MALDKTFKLSPVHVASNNVIGFSPNTSRIESGDDVEEDIFQFS
jgi:hypothetical protein